MNQETPSARARRLEREALISAIQSGEITPEPLTDQERAQLGAIQARLDASWDQSRRSRTDAQSRLHAIERAG